MTGEHRARLGIADGLSQASRDARAPQSTNAPAAVAESNVCREASGVGPPAPGKSRDFLLKVVRPLLAWVVRSWPVPGSAHDLGRRCFADPGAVVYEIPPTRMSPRPPVSTRSKRRAVHAASCRNAVAVLPIGPGALRAVPRETAAARRIAAESQPLGDSDGRARVALEECRA